MKTLIAALTSEAGAAIAVALILVGYCAACIAAIMKGQP